MDVTDRAPARPVVESSPRTAPSFGRTDLRLVSTFVVLLLLCQRLVLPLGENGTSITIPLAYAFLVVAMARHLLVVSRLRAGLFAAAVSACMLTTAVVSWLGATWEMSMLSLALLVVTYVPWIFRVGGGHGAAVVARAGHTLIWTMLAFSAIGILQLSAQLVGVWEWRDYLDALPDGFVIGGYNYDNEVFYDAGIYKATAFVLMEPSFLSQFCALGILIGILLRVRAWKLLLLAGGIASSVSGTGLMLLFVGGVLLLLRAPRMLRPGYVFAAIAGTAVVALTPVAQYMLLRQDEFSSENSSANSRFVAPYQEALEGLLADPVRFFVGAGPGSVDRLIPGSLVGVNGGDVLYSVVPKLAFEYGILAGGLFALFMILATVARAPWPVVPGALVFMVFVLSGALLQPQTAFLAWVLSGLGARGPESEAAPPPEFAPGTPALPATR